jgi:hypothetical protein
MIGGEGPKHPDLVLEHRCDAVKDRGPVPEPPRVDRAIPDGLPRPDVLARRGHEAGPLVAGLRVRVEREVAQIAREVAGIRQVGLVAERDPRNEPPSRVVSEHRRDTVPHERACVIDAAPRERRRGRRQRRAQHRHPSRHLRALRVHKVQGRADRRQVLRRDEPVAVGDRRAERHLILRAAADPQHARTEIAQQVREPRTCAGAHIPLDQRPLDADADELLGDVAAAHLLRIHLDGGSSVGTAVRRLLGRRARGDDRQRCRHRHHDRDCGC